MRLRSLFFKHGLGQFLGAPGFTLHNGLKEQIYPYIGYPQHCRQQTT